MSKYLAIFAPIAIGAALLEAAGMRVGDCRVSLRGDRVSDKIIHFADENRACIRFTLPMKNTGRQQALVIDTKVHLNPLAKAFRKCSPSRVGST